MTGLVLPTFAFGGGYNPIKKPVVQIIIIANQSQQSFIKHKCSLVQALRLYKRMVLTQT